MELKKQNTEMSIWENSQKTQELKKIYASNATDAEFSIFCGIGKATGLNPFLRELWLVKYGGSPAQIFIGRDGYRKTAQEQENYDYHIVDAVYENDLFKIENCTISHSYAQGDRGNLVSAYCIVKKKNSSIPVYNTVLLKEYSTYKSLWNSKPETMLKKVAEAQGLRGAFQGIFAGTYDESENWIEEKKEVKKPVKRSTKKPIAKEEEETVLPDNKWSEGEVIKKDDVKDYCDEKIKQISEIKEIKALKKLGAELNKYHKDNSKKVKGNKSFTELVDIYAKKKNELEQVIEEDCAKKDEVKAVSLETMETWLNTLKSAKSVSELNAKKELLINSSVYPSATDEQKKELNDFIDSTIKEFETSLSVLVNAVTKKDPNNLY